jgi:hemerythrin-like domain-containing protein
VARRTAAAKGARKQSTAGRSGRKRTAAAKSANRRTARTATKATRTKGRSKRAVSTSTAAKKKTAARAAASRTAGKTSAPKPSPLASAATTVRGAVAGAVAAVTKRLPWSSSGQDAITLLETDHRRFEDLLKQGEDTTERAVKGRAELLRTLTTELNLHEMIEEKLLYPALQAHPEARDIVLEGYQEHHVADVLTRELHQVAADDEQWAAKFKVLKESLEHHIQEEEGEMFRKARGLFSREDLEALGSRMAKMKAEARG